MPRPDQQRRAYTTAEDRRAQIIELVERQGFCTILELSQAFAVSDMTIRRDIRALTEDSQLRGVHGGVTMLPQAAITGTDFRARSSRMKEAKRAIAEHALVYVPRHGAIALDAGTTTQELAAVLPPHAQITVVTPSLSVINTLVAHEGVEVVALGGKLHPSTQSFAGQATVTAIGELRVRTFFLAASGLSTGGVYCGNDFDAVTKRALIGVADEVILLTDSSKWSISAMVRACSLSELDRVIIDDGITDEQLAVLKDHDVEVDVVAAEQRTRK